MLTIATEVHAEEKERKETEISKTIGDSMVQQASEHDFKPNWPGQGDQNFDRIEMDGFGTRSRDITPHGSVQQVGGPSHYSERTH